MRTDIKLHKEDLPANLKLGSVVACDCEFTGLYPPKDKLCLIQLYSEESKDVHIVQFINRETYKAPNLVKLLTNNNITKIFHFARADLGHIKHYLKVNVENILDTKIASKLARSYSDNHSLKTLIKEFINIDISKQFQSSDFGGELTEKQLQYCANDVIYLHKIHSKLNQILAREKRLDLYNNCLRFLKTRVDLDLASFKDDIWSH